MVIEGWQGDPGAAPRRRVPLSPRKGVFVPREGFVIDKFERFHVQ